MRTVDRFEGRCWLDWWANSATNLGGFEASVVVAPTDEGWTAHGELINDSARDDGREGFMLLCDLDPAFTLRFQDGSTIEVILTPTDQVQFALVDYPGRSRRQLSDVSISQLGEDRLPGVRFIRTAITRRLAARQDPTREARRWVKRQLIRSAAHQSTRHEHGVDRAGGPCRPTGWSAGSMSILIGASRGNVRSCRCPVTDPAATADVSVAGEFVSGCATLAEVNTRDLSIGCISVG